MAYKSRLNIIAEVYWIKIKTFIHIQYYKLLEFQGPMGPLF